MIPNLTPEQAEAQLRDLIADANLQDAQLDAFCARLPTMRTSDLFGYTVDTTALQTALGLEGAKGLAKDDEHVLLVIYAALLAIKEQIDLRFPVIATTKEG